MILITDIGKDPDDAFALTFALLTGVPIQVVITTCKDAELSANIARNLIDIMGKNTPVVIGSSDPLPGGLNHTNIYHGDLEQKRAIIKPLDLDSIQPDIVVCIGPLTDLKRLMEAGKVTKALFMGQANVENNTVLADLNSYNFKCDPMATEACFRFKDSIRFAFIGKQLAYQVPFYREEIEAFGLMDHPVAKFLADHAQQSHIEFKTRMPDIFDRIYKGTNVMSYCYDPLTMVALTNPGLFTFESVGQHRIGANIDAPAVKRTLLETLTRGLSHG